MTRQEIVKADSRGRLHLKVPSGQLFIVRRMPQGSLVLEPAVILTEGERLALIPPTTAPIGPAGDSGAFLI